VQAPTGLVRGESTSTPLRTTVITQPVIERVIETVRTVDAGGMSSGDLDARLACRNGGRDYVRVWLRRLGKRDRPDDTQTILARADHVAPEEDAIAHADGSRVAIGCKVHREEVDVDPLFRADDTVPAIPVHDGAAHFGCVDATHPGSSAPEAARRLVIPFISRHVNP
jgi:hypothetical protein